NYVFVAGQKYYLPNGLFDPGDTTATAANPPSRGTRSVPGRWGEPEGVPIVLHAPIGTTLIYNNEVRPGRSPEILANSNTGPAYQEYAGTDDDYPSLDFYPLTNPAVPTYPEQLDFRDAAGGRLLPSEEMRRNVTPVDLSGAGRVLPWDIP